MASLLYKKLINQSIIITSTIIFLLVAGSPKSLGTPSSFQAYRVTLTAVNTPLKNVFKAINRQTGISIYNNRTETNLNENQTVTVNFVRADINQVMTFLLSDKKNLKYSIKDLVITISKSEPITGQSSVSTTENKINGFTLSGKVNDVNGNPIPGATVKIKNTTRGTISNDDGTFYLTNVDKGDIVIVSAIGFETTEAPIKRGDIFIMLKQYINKLDENIIIAYGKTTKRFSTGNVGSLKARDIETQPVNNPLLALEGRVAGVFIEQAAGVPGSGISINIQGRNSINSGNDPFYVIDGMPYVSQLLQPFSADITAGATGISGNPLNFINPSDIESIEVLKDADATAIYGSRAANGAVLITTKRGKNGSMRLDFNVQNGWGQVEHKLKVLNAQQYLAMRHEAFKNDGLAPGSTDYDLNGAWDTTKTKDWQKELIGRSSQYTDMQLSISGGNAVTQYLISGGYHRETPVFPGSFSDNRGSVHLNLNSASTNQKFKVQLSAMYMKDNNNLPQIDLTSIALQLAPVAPDPYNSDGSLNWQPTSSGATTYFSNPLVYTKQSNIIKTSNLVSQAEFSYDITKYLTIRVSLGYNNLRTNEIALLPSSASPPERLLLVKPRSTFANTVMEAWTADPKLEFNKEVWKGKLNAIVGTTVQQNTNKRQTIFATGFNNDLLMQDIKSATTLIPRQSIDNPYKYNGLYGRINYNLKDQYILNLSARRDGSSRFGPHNRFHNFGSIGAAWIFSQTQLFQSQFKFISFGKIRGSYGTTGNDQIGEYQFMDLYQSIPAEVPYQGLLGIFPIRINTPNLQWEKTKKISAGLDLGFLDNRILLTADVYRNRSSNQLLFSGAASIIGFSGLTRNLPAVLQNSGWEFTINTTNIKTKNLSWTSNINLTIPRNKLISFDDAGTNITLKVGESISRLPLYHLAGVNDSTGLFQFADTKGQLTDQPTEVASYVNADPKFFGGIQNTFTYKQFTLDFFVQFVQRRGQDLSFGFANAPGLFSGGQSNQPITVLDRWQKVGDHAFQQQFTTNFMAILGQQNARQSDASYSDASYLRLKNISISWQFPGNWMKRIHLQNVKLFAQAQNVFTITNYFGMNPESRGIGMPPLRVITFGAHVSL